MIRAASYAAITVLCILQFKSGFGISLTGKSWPAVPPPDVELLDGYEGGRTADSVLETHSISGRGFLKTVRNRRRVEPVIDRNNSHSLILKSYFCIVCCYRLYYPISNISNSI